MNNYYKEIYTNSKKDEEEIKERVKLYSILYVYSSLKEEEDEEEENSYLLILWIVLGKEKKRKKKGIKINFFFP